MSLVSALSMVKCPSYYKVLFLKVVRDWQTSSITMAVLNFSSTSNVMQLLHNLQHCSNTLTYTIRTHALTTHTYTHTTHTYTIRTHALTTHTYTHTTHTHYIPAVAVSATFWAPWCVHFAVWRKTSICWRFSIAACLRQGTLGQTSVRERKEWVMAEALQQLVRQNIVQALCIFSELQSN